MVTALLEHFNLLTGIVGFHTIAHWFSKGLLNIINLLTFLAVNLLDVTNEQFFFVKLSITPDNSMC